MDSIIKYAFVIVFFLICFSRNIHHLQVPAVRRLLLSFLCSIVADYYLIFTALHPIGILFFCLAQCCYSRILKYPIPCLIQNGLLGCVVLWIAGIFLPFQPDITVLLAVFYFFCLITNVAVAWKKSSPSFAFAITLLLLCDIHVGIFNLPRYFNIPAGSSLETWCTLAPYLIWTFYLPAQLLFSLQDSAKNEKAIMLPS